MKFLIYDTETTGIPDFKAPSDAPQQPYITQIAASLIDLEGTSYAAMSFIIEPDGWAIPDDVAAMTGITTDLAKTSICPALHAFTRLWMLADYRVAHNESFDARMLRIMLKRSGSSIQQAMADEWKAGRALCTANLSTDIINLPPTEKMIRAGFDKPKKPNLAEAYRFFAGQEIQNAHRADADVEACKTVFLALHKGGHIKELSK